MSKIREKESLECVRMHIWASKTQKLPGPLSGPWTPAAECSFRSHDSASLCQQLSASEAGAPPWPNPGSAPDISTLNWFILISHFPVLILYYFYRPQTKLREGNVFTGVYLFTGRIYNLMSFPRGWASLVLGPFGEGVGTQGGWALTPVTWDTTG